MAKSIVNKNGTKNADTIEITASNLIIKAGKGNDKITLTKGKKNTVYGEAGNDTVTVNGGSSNLYGGAGNDVYVIGKNSTGTAKVKDFSVKKGNTDSVTITGGTVKSIGVSGSDVIVKGGKSAALTLQNAKNKTFTVTDTLGNYTVSGSNVKLTLGKNYKGTLTAAIRSMAAPAPIRFTVMGVTTLSVAGRAMTPCTAAWVRIRWLAGQARIPLCMPTGTAKIRLQIIQQVRIR